METQRNGGHGKEGQAGNGDGNGRLITGLRMLAFLLTLIAAILLAVDKQTKTVSITMSPDLPPFNVPVSAKSHYLSAFVFFVVANSIACAFSAISIVVTLANKGAYSMRILVVDVMILALLFSGIGAGTAVGLLGLEGNSHLRWNKVCNIYGKFCHQVMASIFVSFFGGLNYVLVIILSIAKLRRS